MKLVLRFVIKILDAINEWVGRLVSWLTLVLVVVVCFNVVSRYFFNEADAWRGELEWYIFSLIFLLAAGYAFKSDRHVRVDLFYANYAKKDKALTNLIGGLLFLVPWCLVIIIYSFDFAMGSYRIDEISPNTGGLSKRYMIKFAIPLGMSLLLLQALSNITKSALVLLERNPSKTKAT